VSDNLVSKIVILGDGAVGKTSLRRKFMGKHFEKNHLMTLGADFSEKIIEYDIRARNIKLNLQIWDIAGQKEFQAIRQRFIQGCKGMLLVFDLTRRQTFNNLSHWLEEIWSINNTIDIPILLVGNKNDLTDTRVIMTEDIRKYGGQLKNRFLDIPYLNYVETSAKTGYNVVEAFKELGRIVAQRMIG